MWFIFFQEKEWLRIFYYDIEKCIRQNESDAELAEVCLAVLHHIKETQRKDDKMESSLWLPFDHQVMPLSTLFTASKDVFGGSLTTSQEEKIEDLGEGYCYILHAKTKLHVDH